MNVTSSGRLLCKILLTNDSQSVEFACLICMNSEGIDAPFSIGRHCRTIEHGSNGNMVIAIQLLQLREKVSPQGAVHTMSCMRGWNVLASSFCGRSSTLTSLLNCTTPICNKNIGKFRAAAIHHNKMQI